MSLLVGEPKPTTDSILNSLVIIYRLKVGLWAQIAQMKCNKPYIKVLLKLYMQIRE
jgi:hypothetical protein